MNAFPTKSNVETLNCKLISACERDIATIAYNQCKAKLRVVFILFECVC